MNLCSPSVGLVGDKKNTGKCVLSHDGRHIFAFAITNYVRYFSAPVSWPFDIDAVIFYENKSKFLAQSIHKILFRSLYFVHMKNTTAAGARTTFMPPYTELRMVQTFNFAFIRYTGQKSKFERHVNREPESEPVHWSRKSFPSHVSSSNRRLTTQQTTQNENSVHLFWSVD